MFTKITRPLINYKKWRSEGKQVLMYLDDGLGVHKNYDWCVDMALEVKRDLIESGFVPKPEKCVWIPMQEFVFLGNYINCDKGFIKVPESRIKTLLASISGVQKSIRRKNCIHVKRIACIVGQIVSMAFIIGNVAYIMTKSLSIDIQKTCSWNSYIILSENSLDQLQFWNINISKVNNKKFIDDYSCHTVVYSDASGTGYAGYSVKTPFSVAHGMWNSEERTYSSTWRELTAVNNVLLSLLPLLKGNRIKWFTDNQSVTSIVNKGSMKQSLQEYALNIFNICLENNVSIDIEWVPRDLNQKADFYSKIVDYDDWGLSSMAFEKLEQLWGPHDIDWFASDYNSKLSIFYSKFWNMYSSGIDAFTADWFGLNGYFFPPVFLIARVLNYMRQCLAFGTLIVPVWKSASFWPALCPNGDKFIKEVIDFAYLPISRDHYVPGKSKNSLLGNSDLTFKIVALRIDYRNGRVIQH